ncbi:hypothetical protein D915_000050 [Fasciola hepatica]|uniref:Cadherin domain-containing protein n=1 Tax=Fasciola hepatica TaxID=6192 RepID=A0A4E0RN55_FASHE|nr:hypothetical protein D915_000050 [Fasciola hepatica]
MFIGRHEAKTKVGLKLDHWRTVHKRFLLAFLLIIYLLAASDATQTIRFEMNEEKPPGFLVGVLIKHLPDAILTGPGKLTFRTIQEGHAHLFSLGSTDGRIQVACRIDREKLCPGLGDQTDAPQYKSECLLTFSVNLLRLNNFGTDIVDILRIIILLNDIDDNVCFFTPSQNQIVKFPENVPYTQLPAIPLHSPCDLDTGPGNGIEQSSIRLKFSLSSNTSMTSPISGTFSPSSTVLTKYSTQNSLFSLRINRTGQISVPFALYLVPQQMFDYESVSQYELLVEASGMNRSKEHICQLRVTVQIVDQNDFAPKFIQNHSVIKIPETASLNLPIYTLSAIDSDLGPLYSQLIYDFDEHATAVVKSRFRVDHQNGSIFLRAPLDYRKQASYDIPLIVRNPLHQENTESPSKLSEVMQNPEQERFVDRALLQVQVLDVNDKPPVISVFTPDGGDTISLPENTKDIPLDIAVVTVTDEDTGIENSIRCTLEESLRRQFSLTLISSESKRPDSISGSHVDHSPVEVIYKLTSLVPFDRETTRFVEVKIECQDAGSPPLLAEHVVHVLVDDINDHPPVLNRTKLRMTVVEDSDPVRKHKGYIVGSVLATDKDIGVNGRLTYELVNQNDIGEFFIMNSETGIIQSRGNLDREIQSQYQLEVRVTDGGEPKFTATGTVEVNVLDYNDESPVFDKQSYEFRITENNEIGELIGSLRATDKDEGENAVIHFHLESLTHLGDRYLQSVLLSDKNYETKHTPPFDLVSYFDTVHNSYEIRIYSNQVLDREAIVQSDSETSSLLVRDYEPSSKKTSSKLKNKNQIIGHPENPSYKFWIVGEDAGTPKRRGQTLVQIFVDDVNDEAPVFVHPEINNSLIVVSYMEKVGHLIRQLVATDRDSGPNGTVRYRLDQIRFHNYTGTTTKTNSSHMLPVKSSIRYALTGMFTVHSVSGAFRLGQVLTSADVGCLFIVTVAAHDMGVPQVLQTTVNFFVQIDNSIPVDDPMDDADGDYLSDITGYNNAYGASEDGSSLNFYIIISIISVSFLISATLIGAICIALRRRKQTPLRRSRPPGDRNGRISMRKPPCGTETESKSEGRPSNGSRKESLCDSPMNLPAISPKHVQPRSSLIEMKPPEIQTDTSPTTVLDPLLECGPQFMQMVSLQQCSPVASSTVPDLKTLRLVCSEHGTIPSLVDSPYESNQMKPTSTDATIILCTSEYPQNVYSVSLNRPVQTDCQKIVTSSLQTVTEQPVTLINYTHPMEVQHLCIHPSQVTNGKRNSLGSTDQDSGNGDSLNTTSAPIVAGNKQPSIWLPAPLTISRTSPPIHSLTLPLVHVYTPLSCVSETETNGLNSSGLHRQ